MFFIKLCLGNLLFIGAFLVVTQEANAAPSCWKATYGRGVGSVPGTCEAVKQDKSGLLCYPKCNAGYTLVAGVCWQNCPSDFTDTGAHCLKKQAYGRGVGYPANWPVEWDLNGARNRCQQGNSQGCDQWGAVIYPKCKSGFEAIGCCLCSPKCPQGMTDIGVSCQKHSYVVAPITPQCSAAQQYDAGLCYGWCKDNFDGVGPVCWGKCPKGMADCGAMCGESAAACAESIVQMVSSVAEVIGNVASLISSLGGSALLTTAGRQAAVSILKQKVVDTVKSVGKELAKKGISLAGGAVANELSKNPNIPAALVGPLASMTTNPESFDYESFLVGLDPTGLAKVAMAFKMPVCSVPPEEDPWTKFVKSGASSKMSYDQFVAEAKAKAPPVPEPKFMPGFRAKGPDPCNAMTLSPNYIKIVETPHEKWSADDKNSATKIIADATKTAVAVTKDWTNGELYSALIANCDSVRGEPDYAHLANFKDANNWTDTDRSKAIVLVNKEIEVPISRLQALDNTSLMGFLRGSWTPPGGPPAWEKFVIKGKAAKGPNPCAAMLSIPFYDKIIDTLWPNWDAELRNYAIKGLSIATGIDTNVFQGWTNQDLLKAFGMNCDQVRSWSEYAGLVATAPEKWTDAQRQQAIRMIYGTIRIEGKNTVLDKLSNASLMGFLRGK